MLYTGTEYLVHLLSHIHNIHFSPFYQLIYSEALLNILIGFLRYSNICSQIISP
jgi:hypothetical protein